MVALHSTVACGLEICTGTNFCPHPHPSPQTLNPSPTVPALPHPNPQLSPLTYHDISNEEATKYIIALASSRLHEAVLSVQIKQNSHDKQVNSILL